LNSVAINKNGDTASIAYANYQTTNMDDGNWRDAQVSYDSGTKKVSLYIDSNFAVMADLDLGMFFNSSMITFVVAPRAAEVHRATAGCHDGAMPHRSADLVVILFDFCAHSHTGLPDRRFRVCGLHCFYRRLVLC